MQIVSDVTYKIVSAVFCKFAEEYAFMLECSVSYIANWCFGSYYMATKLFRLYSGKENSAYCAIFKL